MKEMSTSYRYADTPLLSACFIHPGRLFILRRVNAAAVYHTSGTGKGLFRVKLVKVHTASMPCALVVGFCVFFIVDSFNVSAILSIEIAEVF